MDYYLKHLFEDIQNVKILDTGFAAMISNGGAVSSYVDLWFHFEDLYRIFDTEATGITMK